MRKLLTILIAGICSLLPVVPAGAQQDASEAVAPTGRLRVALLVTNAALVTRDTGPAEIHGLAPDLSRALADRLRVPFQPIRFQTARQILRAAASDVWDVTFLTIDPERAKSVDFTRPYMSVENCLLVPPGSSVTSMSNADGRGVRIAVYEDSSNSLFLGRTLKQARLVTVESNETALDLLRSGRADAFADNRPLSQKIAKALPGASVMFNPVSSGFYGMAVPKGNAAALKVLNEFLDRARRSGQIEYAIARAQVTGASVLPTR